ncbi:MAG: histidinol-phosphate aminotransferase [Cyclobacteriaceae bacterium]|jgi:histidinol-phosphate aminotransferase
MQTNRRDWLKKIGLASGLVLTGGVSIPTLSAAEKANFFPRALATPIRLNSNENPYGPSKLVRDTMIKSFDFSCRYPSSYVKGLVAKIAEKEGVTKDHIVITGGSTEGLKLTGLTYAANGGKIIAAKPTFLAMMSFAEKMGATIDWVPVDKQMKYDLDEIDRRIDDETSLVFLCNPNNPTGTIVSAERLTNFCENASKKTIVFSDEAYYDYIEEPNYPSMVSLVKKDLDVIVSRTFSKVYGMAGLRIGYLIAKPSIAQRIKSNMVAFTNIPAIEAASAALDDTEFYDFSVSKTKECKQMIISTLKELNLNYTPSHTNFIFFETGMPIADFQSKMKKEGLNVGRPFPPFDRWCRISTGTIEEIELFNEALRKILA